MPIPTCFNTKMSSSGNLSNTKFCRSNTYFRSLVPKHVGAGTWYEVCFVIHFILISAFCWFFKMENVRKCTV